MSQIIDNLYLTFHYLSAVICQNLSSKRCWQDNLEFHRCLVSYGKCSKMLPLFVATNIFMSKLSVADLRGILSRIFEHLSVIKIKQVSKFFFVQKQEILYNNLFYFSRNKLWWWTNNVPSVCLLSGATLRFCLVGIFCQIFENLYLVWPTGVKDKTWPKLVRLWPNGCVHQTMPDFI